MGAKRIKFDSRYVEFVCANANKMTVPKLTEQANELGFGVHDAEAVRRLIKKNGLKFYKSRHIYTEEQVAFIRDNQHLDRKDLLVQFNKKFNLSISATALNVFCSNRKFKVHEHPAQYKKGCNAWKDGKMTFEAKGIAYGQTEKSLAARFKKGHKALFSKVPVGYERKSGRGFIEIRVEDGSSKRKYGGAYNWRLKHHYIWEQHHGEIPKNHIVIFKDGNNENFEIDNLMLAHRGMTAIRYKLQYNEQPKELKPTINAMAALIHKANQLEGKYDNRQRK